MRGRNLLVSGGLAHDFPASSAELVRILATAGVDTEVTTDVAGGLAGLDGSHDLLTVNACRFAMTDEQRGRFGEHHLELDAAAKAGVRAHLAAGGGVLAVHAACICFGEWPEWRRIVGGAWEWGRSGHPPVRPFLVRPTGAAHPVVEGMREFAVTDELYCGLVREPDVVPLAMGMLSDDQGDRIEPVLWARESGGGRVVYSALGHDVASLRTPEHTALLRRAATWCHRAPVPAGATRQPAGEAR